MTLRARQRNFIVVGLIVGGMAAAVFSVIVTPAMNPEEYRMLILNFIYDPSRCLANSPFSVGRIQSEARKTVNKADVQPGGMCFYYSPSQSAYDLF